MISAPGWIAGCPLTHCAWPQCFEQPGVVIDLTLGGIDYSLDWPSPSSGPDSAGGNTDQSGGQVGALSGDYRQQQQQQQQQGENAGLDPVLRIRGLHQRRPMVLRSVWLGSGPLNVRQAQWVDLDRWAKAICAAAESAVYAKGVSAKPLSGPQQHRVFV